jgi:predicted ATPase
MSFEPTPGLLDPPAPWCVRTKPSTRAFPCPLRAICAAERLQSRTFYAASGACASLIRALGSAQMSLPHSPLAKLPWERRQPRDASRGGSTDPRRTMSGAHRVERSMSGSRAQQAHELPATALVSPRPAPIARFERGFFGRERELEAVGDRLSAGHRLVNVIGPGGIGKTRLVWEFLARWPAGTGFVDLSEIHDRDGMIEALSRAIGGVRKLGPPSVASLALALRSRGISLLVVDNFETVVAHSDLLAELVDNASGTQVLVTSREILRVREETVIELAPLAFAGFDLGSSPAARLFLHHLRFNRGDYEPDPGDLERVERIVHALDGIPLAIELCARRAASLGVEAVAMVTDAPLDLANRGPRDVPHRQRTMRAALEGSWRGLTAAEQSIMLAASVFRGGFWAKDLEAIADGTEDVLELLERLREKSLLTTSRGGRFKLLGVIRDYVLEQFDPARRAVLELRHALHFAAHAALFRAPMASAAEWDNLLVAFERLTSLRPIAGSQMEAAGRLLGAFGERALQEAQVAHLIDQADRLFSVTGEDGLELGTFVEALLLRARAERQRGNFVRSQADLDRALQCARTAEDVALVTRCMKVMSSWLARGGQIDAAQSLFEEAKALHDPAPAERSVYDVLALSTSARLAGDAIRSRSLLEDHLRDAREPIERATLLTELGIAALEDNAIDLALGHLQTARDAFASMGWRADTTRADLLIACCELNANRFGAAELLLLGVIATARELERRDLEGYAQGYLGLVEMQRGNDDVARGHFRTARELVPDEGHRALFLAYSASLDALAGSMTTGRALRRDALAADVPAVYRQAIEFLEFFFDLAEAAELVKRDELEAARRPYGAAMNRLAATEDCCGEAQLARRVAQAALDRLGLDLPFGASELTVEREAAWFRVGAGPRIDCAHLGNVRKALLALIAAHHASPADGVPWEQLVEGIWPGERMLPSAAKNRLRVTMARLRKLGLGAALIGEGEGYRLDVGVIVRTAHS